MLRDFPLEEEQLSMIDFAYLLMLCNSNCLS